MNIFSKVLASRQARLLTCLAIAAAGLARAVWVGRGVRLGEPDSLRSLADAVVWAGFSLAMARMIWRWEDFAGCNRIERALRRAEHGRRTLRRRLLRLALFPGLPAAAFAVCPFVGPLRNLNPGSAMWAQAIAGLGAVIFVSLITLLLPVTVAAAAALGAVRLRRNGVLEGLLVTPLVPESLPGAIVGGRLRRGLAFLLAASPLYLLVLNWDEWIGILRPLALANGGNPVWRTGADFFINPVYWMGAVGDREHLAGSAFFGTILLTSDFLMCWRSAALGAWLGIRLQSGVAAAALAGLGALAMWSLRLWFFALAFGFHQHLVGPYERTMAAFALDLLVFAAVAPFCLDRARKRLAPI